MTQSSRICDNSILRFTAPGCSEYLMPFSPDIKVREFRRAIAWLTDSKDGMDAGKKTIK